MIKTIHSGLVSDTDMADGFVRFEGPYRYLVASPNTALGLLRSDTLGAVCDLMQDWEPEVTYALPQQYLPVPEELVDLIRGLSVAEAGDFENCVYGPCVLPATARAAGFSLCEHHDSVLTGWIHLVVA